MHWPKPHRNGDFGYSIGVSTYPDNWKDLATACKQRAGWRCEECGSTERLGAAHVNHDPENPNPELRCLCWSCHRMYDIRTGANHPGKNARRAATRKKNSLAAKERMLQSDAEIAWERKAARQRQQKAQRDKKIAPAASGLERMQRKIREEHEWGW
jgi:hypothetical protein